MGNFSVSVKVERVLKVENLVFLEAQLTTSYNLCMYVCMYIFIYLLTICLFGFFHSNSLQLLAELELAISAFSSVVLGQETETSLLRI